MTSLVERLGQLFGVLSAGLVVLGVAAAGPAIAHPLAPALLELREQADGRVAVRFKSSLYARSARAAAALAPILPADCRRHGESVFESSLENSFGRVERFEVTCSGGLVGREVGVGGLAENGIDAVLRVELQDGRSLQRVLRPDRPRIDVPAAPDVWEVFLGYVGMGARHILAGPDHLLFVFGLTLLVSAGPGRARRLLITLSAFTLGHCLTLGVATLGWLRLPGPPVELAIAASVLLLAVRLASESSDPRVASERGLRLPWVLAGGFGLLHGLGFAGALSEAGLPEGEVALALVSFNIGIEVAQVMFVAAVLAVWGAFRLARGERRLPAWLARVPVYAMGSVAAMWCIERAGVLVAIVR